MNKKELANIYDKLNQAISRTDVKVRNTNNKKKESKLLLRHQHLEWVKNYLEPLVFQNLSKKNLKQIKSCRAGVQERKLGRISYELDVWIEKRYKNVA